MDTEILKSGAEKEIQIGTDQFTDTVLAPGETKVLGTYLSTSNDVPNSTNLLPDYDIESGWVIKLTGKTGTLTSVSTAGSGTLLAGEKDDKVKFGIRYPGYFDGETSGSDVFSFDYYLFPYGGLRQTDPDSLDHEGLWMDNETIMTYDSALTNMPLPHPVGDYIETGTGGLGERLEDVTLVTTSLPTDFFMATMGLRTLVAPPTSSVTNYIRNKGYYTTNMTRTAENGYGNFSNMDENLGWTLTALTGGGSATDPDMFDIDVGVATGGHDAAFLAISNQSAIGGVRRWAPDHVPVKPFYSLGDLATMDISPSSKYPPRISNAFANSTSSALIHQESVFLAYGRALSSTYVEDFTGTDTNLVSDLSEVVTYNGIGIDTDYADTASRYFFGLDHSYCSNHVLLDDWFVSSIAPETIDFSANEVINRAIADVYEDHLSGTTPLVNEFYKPRNYLTDAEASVQANKIRASGSDYDEDHYLKVAAELNVEGMFNINSTSYKAWATMLKSLKGVQHSEIVYSGSSHVRSDKIVAADEVLFSRMPSTVVESDVSNSNPLMGSSTMTDNMIYNDHNTDDLSDDTGLAVEIVKQIKLRGPFLSLSEFFNRQLTTNTDLALSGAVESALQELSEKASPTENPFNTIQTAFPQQATKRDLSSGAIFTEASEGYAAYGYPGWIRQADVLKSLIPIMSARDDSFTIRAYGSAVGADGEFVEVWCEALVERTPKFVDASNEPTDYENISLINLKFGRKFVIRSFRWLIEDEV